MQLPPLTRPTEPIEIDSDSESSQHVWPTYTNIVVTAGKKDLSLTSQYHEIRVTVRKAMDLILERLLFQNGFPSLATRAIWSRRSFLEASAFMESSVGTHVREHYQILAERFKSEAQYVRELSRLVRIHAI